jgi:hypothetical protein
MIKRGRKIDKSDLSVFDNTKKVKEHVEDVITFEDRQDLALEIAYRMGDKYIVEDVRKLLSIPPMHRLDLNIIGDIMASNPLLEGRWAFIVNEAISEYECKQLEFEIFQAECDARIRNENVGGKISEPRIKNLIILDENYKKLSMELIKLKREMNNIKSMAVSIGSKGLKAVSIASLVKQEMKLTTQL